jgi:glutathione synthase/RimK-type ligase-like ATP-grasp enzyme
MGERRKINRAITIVEGRECNQPVANELRDTAIKMGFDAKVLKKINSANIAEGTLDEVFSDCVIWRCPVEAKNTYETERVISYLQNSGKLLINAQPAGGRFFSSDKFFQHGLFQLDPVVKEHSLEMHMALSRANIDDLLKRKKLKYPFLLKPDFGTRGEGIILVKSKADLDKVKKFSYLSTEPYIKSTYDWRVFVMGGVALGAMKKQGDMTDDANFKSRASGRKRWNEDDIDVMEEIGELSVHAAEVSGLEYAGIDLIRDDETGKFIVLETNIAAGWQNGFFEATGISVPEENVNWFADRALLFESTTYKAVKTYCERRLRFLTRKGQKKYQEIVSWERKIKRSDEICNFDLEHKNMPLVRRLSSAYALLQDGRVTKEEMAKIKMLISSVEEYEISRFGNFVGKDSGSLEDSILRTAYYLAVKEKLDAKK